MTTPIIHILDKQSDLIVDVLDNTLDTGAVFYEDKHVDSGNNFEVYDFFARADVESARHLTGRNRLIIQGDRPGTWNEFVIFNVYKKSGGLLEVKTNGSYVEIAKEPILNPFNIGSVDTQTAMEFGLAGTEWSPGLIEGGGLRAVESADQLDRYSYLVKIAGIYGMNLRFRVAVHGYQVVGRYVDLVGREGFFVGKEITLGKDLVDVVRHEATDEIVTALRVYGPEQEDGTRIIVTVEDEDARQRWGRNGKHLWGQHEIDTENKNMPESEIRSHGAEMLKKLINGVVKYTVSAVALESVFGLDHEATYKGDKVRIKDESFEPPLYLDASVIEVSRSLSDPLAKEFVLGDFIEYTEEEVLALYRKLRSQLAEKVDRGEVITIIDEEAIIKSPIPPENPRDNQLWLDTSLSPNQLYRWNGVTWQKATPTVPSDIGAVPPSYVDQKAVITQLNMEWGTIEETVGTMDAEVAALRTNQYLAATGAETDLVAAQLAYQEKAAQLISKIEEVVADNNVTQVENTAVSAFRTEYRTALNNLITAIRAAEDEITKGSANEVIEFGERKIFKGATIPAAADVQELDLWLDARTTPPVWRQYINGSWTQVSRTNFSDMQGQVTGVQITDDTISAEKIATNAITAKHISANVITSNMITTAGLDAGVITYGTMTGITADVTNAGMTSVGSLSSSTRFWAGATYVNRNSAPFRVTQAGTVYASNLVVTGGSISGVSIDVSTDVYVGGRLSLGSGSSGEKRIDFGGHNAWIYSAYGNLYIETGTITTYGTLKAFEFNGSRLWNAGVLYLEAGEGVLEVRTSTSKELKLLAQNGSRSTIKWTDTGLQIRNNNDGLFASISASDFVVNSEREAKKNIEPMGDAIGKIRSAPIYTFERESDEYNERAGETVIGTMVDEAPAEIVAVTGDGIVLYSHVSLLHKAVQELAAVVEKAITPGGLQGGTNDVTVAEQMNHALTLFVQKLPEQQALEVAAVFPPWKPNYNYLVGDRVRHGKNADGEAQLYQVLQAHKSQTAWTPEASASLFKKIGFTPTGTPLWVQPLGSTDAYQQGDIVSHNGKIYTSTAANNVWEPGVYGWTLKV